MPILRARYCIKVGRTTYTARNTHVTPWHARRRAAASHIQLCNYRRVTSSLSNSRDPLLRTHKLRLATAARIYILHIYTYIRMCIQTKYIHFARVDTLCDRCVTCYMYVEYAGINTARVHWCERVRNASAPFFSPSDRVILRHIGL